MLTLAQLRAETAHAIPGGLSTVMSPGTTAAAAANQLINEAGAYLFSHEWTFRLGIITDVAIVAAQGYVDLPADYGGLQAIEYNDLATGFVLTSHQELLQLRAKSASPTGFAYWAAVVQPTQTNQTTAMGAQRLLLYPDPLASDADGLKIIYRRDWAQLTDDTHIANVPRYAVPLLRQYVRAFAEGFDDEAADEDIPVRAVNVNNLLAVIDNGPIFAACKRRDGANQRVYGELENGLVETLAASETMPDFFGGRQIASPYLT